MLKESFPKYIVCQAGH